MENKTALWKENSTHNRSFYFIHFPTAKPQSLNNILKCSLQEIVNTYSFNNCQLNWFPMTAEFEKGSGKTLFKGNDGH